MGTPVAAYVFAGSRADAWTESVEAWLAVNQRSFTTFGAFLVADGVAQLV